MFFFCRLRNASDVDVITKNSLLKLHYYHFLGIMFSHLLNGAALSQSFKAAGKREKKIISEGI
jgi:hypothetical protein